MLPEQIAEPERSAAMKLTKEGGFFARGTYFDCRTGRCCITAGSDLWKKLSDLDIQTDYVQEKYTKQSAAILQDISVGNRMLSFHFFHYKFLEKQLPVIIADSYFMGTDKNVVIVERINVAGVDDVGFIHPHKIPGRQKAGNGFQAHARHDTPIGQLQNDIIFQSFNKQYIFKINFKITAIGFYKKILLV